MEIMVTFLTVIEQICIRKNPRPSLVSMRCNFDFLLRKQNEGYDGFNNQHEMTVASSHTYKVALFERIPGYLVSKLKFSFVAYEHLIPSKGETSAELCALPNVRESIDTIGQCYK